MYIPTTAIKKVLKLKKRLRCVQGGTSAGKTIAILEDLIDQSQAETSPTITSVVSESFPHLKRGAIRDFLSIMEEQKYYEDKRWNRTDYMYTFAGGAKIEFFSADQSDKVRGPRRDRLFINEANNVPFETFEQLEIRTKEAIYLDWNPTTAFWFYDEILGKRSDVDHIILTYKDNEGLDPRIVATIEQRMSRKGWWRVFGEGLLGEVEGKIYTGWRTDFDDVPQEARLERGWIDFGYTNDPSSLGLLYAYNGGYILDEVAYQKGMSNKTIADTILNSAGAKTLWIADSAEPKSIDEIRSYGVNVLPSEKGRDSVANGIQVVQNQRLSVTKRSINIIKEYRNYLWETDRDGKVLNTPEHEFSHSMDGIRYALTSIIKLGSDAIERPKRPRLKDFLEFESPLGDNTFRGMDGEHNDMPFDE